MNQTFRFIGPGSLIAAMVVAGMAIYLFVHDQGFLSGDQTSEPRRPPRVDAPEPEPATPPASAKHSISELKAMCMATVRTEPANTAKFPGACEMYAQALATTGGNFYTWHQPPAQALNKPKRRPQGNPQQQYRPVTRPKSSKGNSCSFYGDVRNVQYINCRKRILANLKKQCRAYREYIFDAPIKGRDRIREKKNHYCSQAEKFVVFR